MPNIRALSDEDVRLIHELAKERARLLAERSRICKQLAGLSNAAIAQKFEVAKRTIDKALYEGWG